MARMRVRVIDGIAYADLKGDTPGHEFHGNQWASGNGGHAVADLRSHLISEHEGQLRNSKERNVARVGTSKEQASLHRVAHERGDRIHEARRQANLQERLRQRGGLRY